MEHLLFARSAIEAAHYTGRSPCSGSPKLDHLARLQLVSVADVLHSTGVHIPPAGSTFKHALRADQNGPEQTRLDLQLCGVNGIRPTCVNSINANINISISLI